MTPTFQPFRLRDAREYCGLTIQELADKLGVTKQAISLFENGKSKPSAQTLLKIESTLGFPYTYYYKESIVDTNTSIFFRKFDTTSKQDRFIAEIKLKWIIEIYFYLKEINSFPELLFPKIEINDWSILENKEIEDIADKTREFWNLGNAPIPHLVEVLENNGLVVSRISLSPDIDAFSTVVDQVPFIILGDEKKSSVRSRFDAAHELGHLILHKFVRNTDLLDKVKINKIEKQANYFAGAFLFPKKIFLKEFVSLDLEILQRMKVRWLMSMQSIVMRARDLELITENQKILFFRNLKMKGYKIIEPLDEEIPKENPEVIKKALFQIKTNPDKYNEFIHSISLNEKVIHYLH